MSPSSSIPSAATATSKRIILVHGTGHGGWCWYKVATLLRAAGHRVDAPDLMASGADACMLCDAPTFEDYSRPLLDTLRGHDDRAVLVGHSFGGVSVALASEDIICRRVTQRCIQHIGQLTSIEDNP